MLIRPLLRSCSPVYRKYGGKINAFVLTYVAYAMVTAARLPYSICKGSLRPDTNSSAAGDPGWEPFTDDNGQELLGTLDTIFMFGYAGAMPFMGMMADRSYAPGFLGLGMIMVGLMLVFFGLAYTWQIHSYAYFAVLTFFGGCFQSVAYPCVIVVMSRWFGKSNIGFTLGLWSSCTPLGTIAGKLGATAALAGGWHSAYIYPGLVSIACGTICALFLVDHPRSVGLLRPGEARLLAEREARNGGASLMSSVAPASPETLLAARQMADVVAEEEEAVPLCTIIRIPGMVSFCCACFFSKLSYYAFVFWLPFYLQHALGYNSTDAGNTSTFFDCGGFAGGIIGGVVIDRLKLKAPVLITFQSSAVVMLFLYMYLGLYHMLTYATNCILLVCLGFFVTTPYSLITSVMSTELGRHPVLQGNSKAAGTVTALLDGVGSFGAVLQGLMIAWFSKAYGWTATFIMLMVFSAFSAACLFRPTMEELRARPSRSRPAEIDIISLQAHHSPPVTQSENSVLNGNA